MKVIEANDALEAQNLYMLKMDHAGIKMSQAITVFVETIHRPFGEKVAFLCYLAKESSISEIA